MQILMQIFGQTCSFKTSSSARHQIWGWLIVSNTLLSSNVFSWSESTLWSMLGHFTYRLSLWEIMAILHSSVTVYNTNSIKKKKNICIYPNQRPSWDPYRRYTWFFNAFAWNWRYFTTNTYLFHSLSKGLFDDLHYSGRKAKAKTSFDIEFIKASIE